MHHFAYRDGVLHAEDVALPAIAGTVGTPFYCYSSATIERHFGCSATPSPGSDALVCYAMKANSNQAVLKTLARLGAGMDVVSEGELRRARAAGVPGDKIIFSGVGKTRDEMALGLDEGILCFNVESEPELETLSEVAGGARRDGARSPSASTPTSTRTPTPRSRPASRRTSSACRSRAPAPSIDRARAPARPRRRRRRHAHRLADHRPRSRSTTPSRCSPNSCATLRADGHAIDHVDLGGGLGIPYRVDNDPPPLPEALRRDRRAQHARARLQAVSSSRAG